MALPQVYGKLPLESIEETEQEPSSSPTPVRSERTFKDKLGVYNILVLAVGTAIIFLAVGFLAFVWHVSIVGTQHGRLPHLWKLIVSRQWVSRTITLSSILVRVATAAQLCVFAAVMAALILERVGASTEDLPLVSRIYIMLCPGPNP